MAYPLQYFLFEIMFPMPLDVAGSTRRYDYWSLEVPQFACEDESMSEEIPRERDL